MGDPKIVGSTSVESGRIGRGASLDTHALGDALVTDMRAALRALGYDEKPVSPPAVPDAAAAAPGRVASVDELFSTVFPDRLAHATLHADRRWAIRFLVTGAGQRTWDLQVSGTAVQLAPATGDDPDFVVAIDGADLISIVNHEVTVAEALFRNKLHVKGDVTPEALRFGEQLAWTLFGV
jgi:hypothetical protein